MIYFVFQKYRAVLLTWATIGYLKEESELFNTKTLRKKK